MEERDTSAFENMYVEAIECLKSDPVTADFGEYFDKEYSPKVKSWAFCYRQHVGLNTNMHLERMHGIIKYIYLGGKKPKRLDIAIHALMRYVRDKLIDKLISFHKGKLTRKISAIRQRHKTSLSLDSKNVVQIGNKWNVMSSGNNEIYEVAKVKDSCNCNLKCVQCQICIHEYICTCPDSAIKFHMCKHIHLIVHQVVRGKENSDVETQDNDAERVLLIDDRVDDMSDLQETILKDLRKNKVSPGTDLKKKQDHVRKYIEETFNDASSSIDDLDGFYKVLVQYRTTLNATKSMRETSYVRKEPLSNKRKVEHQRRFVTTKKRKVQQSSSIVVPTVDEKERIALSLLSGNKVVFSDSQDCEPSV